MKTISKTLTPVVFGLAISFALVACGGGEKKTEVPSTDTTTTTTTTTDTDTAMPDGTASAAADPALVAKGAEVFGEYCSICHGDEGEGSGKSPALRGDGSLAAYPTEEALLAYTSKTMPKDSPGDLSADEYKAVVAWMRN